MMHGRVLRSLKDGTAAQHEAVERRVDLKNRLRGPGTYADLLGGFYGFYSPIEISLGAVRGFETIGIDFQERRKAPRLAADLVALGRVPGAVPLWSGSPKFASLGQALGCLYVLEGATLGGQFIRKAVEAHLGLTASHGCSFFAAYGDRVGPMWEAFRAALVRHAATPQIETEIVTAACDTFAALDGWLASGLEGTP